MMTVKIMEYSFSLIKRVAELEFHELFGEEKLRGEIITIKCILTPNDCDATTCHVNNGFSKKFLSIMREFKYGTIEFDGYIFEFSLISEEDIFPIEKRICIFNFRRVLSYSMEEDERWWSPDLEGRRMRDLH